MEKQGGEPSLASVRLAIDYALAQILAEAPTVADATPRILASIGETLGWEMGAIWELDRSADVVRCVATWQSAAAGLDAFEEASENIGLARGVGLPGRVLASGQPAWIEDVTKEGNFPRSRAAAAAGLHGAFAFPIRSGRKLLGVMEFFSREVQAPDHQLLDMMTIAGAQLGQFMDRQLAEEEIRRSEALKTAMLESALDCVVAMDHEGRVIEFNPAAESTFGYRREDVIGKEMAELIIPPHLRERHRRGLARLLAGGEAPILGKRLELTGMRSDGSEFPVELAVTQIRADGPPIFTGYLRDSTERRRGEEALRFLAEASAILDASLDLDTTLEAIARLCVPFLADGCMVDVLEEDGTIRRAGAAVADPSYEPMLRELQRHPIDPSGPHPIASVMRSGRTEIVHNITDSFRKEISQSDSYYEALRRWPAQSVVVAPLKVRGRVLGTMSLASFSPERAYGLDQISVVDDLAIRAAHAVENALLFRERTAIARTLEQSLLPPTLPSVPGVELAARFQPAGGGGEMSGDFYDVFHAGDACWAFVIGDVSGRGVSAAAVSVLARHTIRAAAVQESSPSRILQVLNETLRAPSEEIRVCSAAVALLRSKSGAATLTIAAGGHPLPLVLRRDGGVEAVGATGTLLGAVPEPQLHDRTASLAAGDAIIFYTNGVAEPRPANGHFGPDELLALVRTCGELDASATVDCIEQGVLAAHPNGSRDDAALLVAKVK